MRSAVEPRIEAGVPARLRETVLLHLLRQGVPGAPLVLAVHGPPGTGKTFGCEAALRETGAHVARISGGQLESPEAGAPAELVRRTYVAAGRLVLSGTVPHSAILIDDFDAAVGDWGALVQTTVNTQSVLSELMHLCDTPLLVDGKATARVPIILTGNDFSKVYVPLRRPGRMALFDWRPDAEERAVAVAGVFPHLNATEVRRLVSAFPDRHVSFFSHLGASLVDDRLREHLDRHPFADLRLMVADGRIDVGRAAPLGEILGVGAALDRTTAVRNHLSFAEVL